MTTFIILLVILISLGVLLVSLYNRLVSSRNETDNAFSQIEVQLNRRYDLIPNLVNVAKKYMSYEQETLEAIISARNQAKTALDNAMVNSDEAHINALSQAENHLGNQMGGLLALFENYPDLKANTQMSQLMEELTSTENKVAFARQHFNDVVTAYNNRVEQFPSNILAGIYGFIRKGLLEIDNIEAKREPVTVEFD